MNSHSANKRSFFRRSIASMLLLLFLSGFTVETMAISLNDGSQSELPDFGGDKDAEEDTENEKEKEDKILEDRAMITPLRLDSFTNFAHPINEPNEEIQKVFSPPPEGVE